MSSVSLLRKSARVAAIISTLVSAALPLTFAAPAAAEKCPDIEVIFARGTNDAPDLGRPGRPSPMRCVLRWAVAPSAQMG